MTTVQAQAQPSVAMAERRNAYREELAALLALDSTAMSDNARLTDDLALDSLAMMSLLTWLETRGIVVGDHSTLTTVDDILSLLDRKATSGAISLRIVGDLKGAPPSPVDLPTLPESHSPLQPVLSSHAVRLTPIVQSDLDFLYELTIQPQTGFRWRYRGTPPSPEQFAADLWTHVLVQFVARRVGGNQPVGQVVAYGADQTMRHAYVGAVFQPSFAGTGLAAQAVAVFVRYLFHSFPFRKLYLEIPGFNWSELRSGQDRIFSVEGVLRDHYYYAGREWDKYLCAIYPEQGLLPEDVHFHQQFRTEKS